MPIGTPNTAKVKGKTYVATEGTDTVNVDAGPAYNGAAVNLSSTDATLSPASRALFIGGAGDVKVDFANGGTGITLSAVPVGILPVAVNKIYKTGTTATNITALW